MISFPFVSRGLFPYYFQASKKKRAAAMIFKNYPLRPLPIRPEGAFSKMPFLKDFLIFE
jgi:hypothetical protein